MSRSERLLDVSHVTPDQLSRLRAASAALRPYVPGIAAEATRLIQTEVPTLVRPHDPRYAQTLGLMVEGLIGHFIDLMGDQDLPSQDVLDFARQVGAGEAREGRTLDAFQTAIRIGAGLAIGRLTEQAERMGHGGDVSEIGQLAQAVFAYTDHAADAVASGHAEAEARAAGERESRRHKLIDLLLEPDPSVVEIGELAHKARWPLPKSVAVVALQPRDADAPQRPALPPEALLGLHLDRPCVIMPDPDGPGRRHHLEEGLRDWVAALGPAVHINDAAKSMRWAGRALTLAAQGLIVPDKLIVAAEHMPLIVMMQEPELVELVAAERLAPLRSVRPALAHDLTETLTTLLESRFNATVVAARLHLHPQTVRYRLRKLEELFGSDLYDSSHQLELHMVLHARLAAARAVKDHG